jgi:hypothetical protein
MKKLLLVCIILSGIYCLAQSQTKLQYSIHAIHAGVDNPMSYCKYTDPGMPGSNQKWDFSNLIFVTPFTGYVAKADFSTFKASFPKANTVLTEFNSHFYMNVTETQTEQYGYISADGKTKISYSVPFVKMKYPFGYGDIYSGSISGTYSNAANIEADLAGIYTVEADAYGTLVLPGNSVFNDVIRVKTIKEYTTKFPNADQSVEIVTYRWYNSIHRYPLLVLTEYITKAGQNKYTDYQAAYNSNALKSSTSGSIHFENENINIFPNPVTSVMHLTFNTPVTGTAYFNVFDASGRKVSSFQNEIYYEGIQEFDLSDNISGIKTGNYILRVNIGSLNFSKEFSKADN